LNLHGAIDMIDKWKKESKKVLVHCINGDCKSVIVILAYMVKYCDFTLREAYYFVKEMRKNFAPIPLQLKQLVNFELLEKGISTLNSNDWVKENTNIVNPNKRKKKHAEIEDFLNTWLDLERYLKAYNPEAEEEPKISSELFLENLINILLTDPEVLKDIEAKELDIKVLIPKIKNVAKEWYNFQTNDDGIIPIL